MTTALASTVCYSGNHKNTTWQGRQVADETRFAGFMHEVVRPRISDEASSFESDLRGLATTGMSTEFVERVLNAIPEPEGWEVGEALAECALRNDLDCEVHWPWNTVRDRRTPRASLPGTDLVGFFCQDETVLLLFGEVKTSSDADNPPNVMYGGSGMTWQLEESAKRLDIQRSLLQWLHARCRIEPYCDLYKKAVSRYLASDGKELLIVGVLMRDTPPNVADLQSRGYALSTKLGSPTRVKLIAWYLPVAITEWARLLREDAL